MDSQLVAALLVVIVSAAYVVRQSVRTWAASTKKGCSGGCGCVRVAKRDDAPTVVFIPSSELVVRRRNN